MARADRPGSRTDGTAPDATNAPSISAGLVGSGVALDQLFDTQSLSQLRSAVAAHGAELGLLEPDLGDLVLVAHELASNAVRHGEASQAKPGRLRLWPLDSAIVCEVADRGPGITDPDTVGTVKAPPGAAGGRGLWIVRQVVRTLDIDTGPHGTTVTATIPLSRRRWP